MVTVVDIQGMYFYNLFEGVLPMSNEYEIVSHSQLRYMHIFLVRLLSRTTHLHREIELGMILDGTVTLHIGSRSCQLTRGDIYVVNPLEAHEFLSEGSGALVLSIQLSSRYLEALLPGIQATHYSGSARVRDHYAADSSRYELLCYYFVETAHAYLGRKPNYAYSCFSSLAQLLWLLKQDLPDLFTSRDDDRATKQKSERLLSITDYIEEHFTHKLLLEDIAKREGLSLTYLSHLFKDSLGITFQDYIKEKRFEYACGLLTTTDRKILDISVSSGFSDVRYLTRLFHERFGCTPKEYRKLSALPEKRPVSTLESSQYFFTQQDSYLLLTPLRNQLQEKMRQVKLTAVNETPIHIGREDR